MLSSTIVWPRSREATGGALAVRHGDPVEEVPALAAEIGADTVYVAKDFAPYGRRRDETVADALRSADRQLRGIGSPYAVEPGTVEKQTGGPYSVFTPFSRTWREHEPGVPIDAPRSPNWVDFPVGDLPGRPEVAFDLPAANEDAVIARWRRFRDDGLGDYRDRRDLPAVDGTSHLSPFLKYGVVHPRQLIADIDRRNEGQRTFETELAWRDFYADVLYQRPDAAWNHWNAKFDTIRYDSDDAARSRFARWQRGRTGFPIVDAGMRQLLATGWMHNRVRMIVASFLVKDLHLPWTWGAKHFLQPPHRW